MDSMQCVIEISELLQFRIDLLVRIVVKNQQANVNNFSNVIT